MLTTLIASRHAPGGGHDDAPTPCSRKCCWTPHGHSTVRDAYPTWHALACHCHINPKERRNA